VKGGDLHRAWRNLRVICGLDHFFGQTGFFCSARLVKDNLAEQGLKWSCSMVELVEQICKIGAKQFQTCH
jgi:hypothetical protein